MKNAPESTPQSTAQTTPKRDEIIQTAFNSFYHHGFHATGVDAVMADSGISKRTIYKYFRSKEELVAATLTYYETIIFGRIPDELSKRHKDPKKQILSLFDLKAEEFALNNFNGCLAINAKVEFDGSDHEIEAACSGFYQKLEAYVTELCAAAKLKSPKTLAHQIILLFAGSVVMGQMHRDPDAPNVAKEIVKTLLKGAV